MLRPKKNSYKEFDNEKKIPAAQKFPTTPNNFSNSPSLTLSGFTEHQIIFYQVSNTIT